MGLFSKLRAAAPSGNQAEATARAVMTPSLLTMAIDGSVDDSELAQLSNVCAFSPIFHAIGGDRTQAMAVEIFADMKSRGAGPVMDEAISSLSPALRETALCFAMRIALADGTLDENEKNALIVMSRDMGIKPENVETMFAVISMMQRSAAA